MPVLVAAAAQFLVALAAAATAGRLVAAAFLLPCGQQTLLGPDGAAARRRAASASWLWAGLALVAVPASLADQLGVGLKSALRPELVTTYGWDLASTRQLLITALVAVAVALLAPMVRRIGSTALLALLALLGAALPGLALPHGALPDHGMPALAGVLVYACSTLWLGSTLALREVTGDTAARAEGDRRHARWVPWYAVGLTAGMLLLVAVRLPSATALTATGFGRAALASAGAALLVGALSAPGSSALRRTGRVALSTVAGLAAAVTGLVVLRPPAGDGSGPRTVAEQLVGGPLPAAPTVSRLLAPTLDSVFLLGLALGTGLYLAGLRRLRRRGDRWPVGRSLAWFLGLFSLWVVTGTGLARYAPVSFSAHMVQHMVLSMLSPILLVLGAPLTLALRALRPAPARGQRGPREWLVAVTHSGYVRLLTHPAVALAVYVSGLYGLYFTGVFGWLMASHLGHVLMLVHFLAAGYLFFWTIIGVDAVPRVVPHWAKFVDLLASMGVHAFFGVIIMMSTTLTASGWYGSVAPEWLRSPLQDQFTGGGIAWAFGELPSLVIVLVLAVQWARSDDRSAQRYARQAERDGDAELIAYNAHLARLNRLPVEREVRS